MDADVLRMVADLGSHRRDIVSAPQERGGGRRGGGDWREEVRAMEAAQEHRKQACSGPEDNQKAQMLKLWNTEKTFGSDAIAESLENRMDGQGHRARLREQLQGQQARSEDNHRYQRNYRHDANELPPHPSARGRPSEHDSTPRNFRFTAAAAAAPPARTAPALDPNRARAPSPRAAGRVRFVNGQRVTSSTAQAPTSTPPPRMPAVMHPNGTPQPPQAPGPSPQPAPAVIAPSRPVDAPQSPRTRATAMTPSSTASPRPRTAVTAAPTVAAHPAIMDATSQARYVLAKGYVEGPTETYEKYYREHPNELCFVDQARKDLAVEAVKCVRSGEKETYIKKHLARKWIVEAAEIALTRGDAESGNALTRPTVLAIVRAAIEQKQKDSQVMKANTVKAPAQSTPALPPAAPATSAPKTSQSSASLAPTPPAPTASTHVPGSQPRASSTSPTLRDMVKEHGDRAVDTEASRRTEGSQAATSSVVAANGARSRRDSVMDPDSPATTNQSTARQPAATRGGMLTATYLDASGKLVQQTQTRVDAPVVANITITSTVHHYDLRQLAEATQRLAQQMADRTMGNFRKDEDGLWVEADSLGLLMDLQDSRGD